MNVGIIGLGYWGKNIYRNLLSSPDVDKIFYHDKNEIKQFKNFIAKEKDFFNEQNNIEAYFVASPTNTHAYYIDKILSKNKYVCVTKPFVKSAKELKVISKKHNNINKIFLDHTYLYHPGINKIKKIIEKNTIGKLIYFDSERISFGKFYHDQNVIEDLAVHDLYILDYLTGGKKPKSIQVMKSKNYGNKIYLSNIFLKYQNGFIANIKVNWLSPFKSRRIIIGGKKKLLIFDDLSSDKKIQIYDKGLVTIPKSKADPWEYRIGDISIPVLNNTETLSIMIESFIKFCKRKNKKNSFDHFNHGLRVIDTLDRIKKIK